MFKSVFCRDDRKELKELSKEGDKMIMEYEDKENQLSTAKEMLKDNIDIETISKYTKLSIEEIQKLNTEEE